MKKKLPEIFNTFGFLMIGIAIICLLQSDIVSFYVFVVLAVVCAVGMVVSLCKKIKNN